MQALQQLVVQLQAPRLLVGRLLRQVLRFITYRLLQQAHQLTTYNQLTPSTTLPLPRHDLLALLKLPLIPAKPSTALCPPPAQQVIAVYGFADQPTAYPKL